MWSPLVRVSFALVALAMSDCQRAPPEPFVARPSGPVAAPSRPPVSSGVPSERCVLPTPAQAPPAATPGPAPGCPADPEAPGAPAVTVPVAFPDAEGHSGVVVAAEVVRSAHDTTRGLMYRTTLPDNGGMLFYLGVRDDHKFWMHNTCIPLDLMFIDDDGLVVGIVESAPTLNDESRGVGCPSVYVLEVNAGWARRRGVQAGQRAIIPPSVKAVVPRE